RLESQRLRSIHEHEQFSHVFPAMHSTPTNFPFRGQPFSVVLGDRASLPESFGDTFRIADRILPPLGRTAGGIDANDSVVADADVTKFPADCAGFAHLGQKILSLFDRSHGRAASGRRPHGSDERSNDKSAPPNTIGKPLEIIISGIDTDMRLVE